MSVKRLALIAAVGSHHRIIHKTPTTSTTIPAVTQFLAATSPTATTFTRATDDDSLNLNAAALGSGSGVEVDGGRSSEEDTNDVGSGGGGIAAVPGSDVGGNSGTNSGATSGFNYFTEHLAGGGGLYQGHQAMRPGATLHGNVNVLLGGAMLSVVITVVCVVCYCCHRNTKKRSESIYRQQRWNDNAGPNMEVYSVEQCYDASNCYTDSPQSTSYHLSPTGHSGPPPSYDSVLALDEFSPRPPPPPKYQPSRHPKSRCCTARHTAFNHNTIVDHHHCRKYHHPQHPPNHGTVRIRGPCTCLQRQVHELNNNRSHLSNSIDTRSNLNKSVPNPSDSLNNNVSNNNNVTFEIDKPLYEGAECQLLRRPRQCSHESIQQNNIKHLQQLHAADVENGNFSESRMYSSDGTEISLHVNQTNSQLINSEDTRDEVKRVSNEANSNTVQMRQVELELSSNLDQKNPRRRQPHDNHQPQRHHCEHSQQEQLQQQQQEQLQHQQQQEQSGTHNLSALDTFNDNGIIRMDMSQIIDTTGLPTYEAAIKLESSGYV